MEPGPPICLIGWLHSGLVRMDRPLWMCRARGGCELPLLRSPPSLSWWEAGGVSSLGMCPLCAPSPAERTSPTLRQAHRLLFAQEPPTQSGHRWSKWVAKERSTSPEPVRSPAPSTASGSAGCCQDACPGRLQKASWDSPAGQSLQHRPRF